MKPTNKLSLFILCALALSLFLSPTPTYAAKSKSHQPVQQKQYGTLIEALADMKRAYRGERDAIKKNILKMIKSGANVNAWGHDDVTPLMCAVDPKLGVMDFEIVAALINAGADVNAQDGWDETPLFHAVNASIVGEFSDYYSGEAIRLKIVNLLLKAGAKSINGDLLCAAQYKRPKAIYEALINAGADVNEKNEHGYSVLLYTMDLPLKATANPEHYKLLVKERPEKLKLLLAHGAAVNAQDSYGYTALDQARSERGNSKHESELELLLRQAGGKTREELKKK